MTTHTVHPDISKQGLADNCPRCSEHATRLYALDNEVLEALHYRLREGLPARSAAECLAMHTLGTTILVVRRLGYRHPKGDHQNCSDELRPCWEARWLAGVLVPKWQIH